MHKPIFKQFAVALGLLLMVMLLLVGILVVLGEAKIDASSGSDLGLYSSAFAGLPSYYNPLFILLEITEFPALAILPIVLMLLGKRLRVQALPWLLVVPALPLSIVFMRTFTVPVADPAVDSFGTQFAVLQIIPVFTLVAGYIILAIVNSRPSGRKFIHKKRKPLT